MALVIVSTGTLARSRLRTVTLRKLAALAGALTFAGLLSGFALGFLLAGATHGHAGGAPEFANFDPARPGSQTIIQEIGILTGRLIRLEALAGRLDKRVGATPRTRANAADLRVGILGAPAGGPLLAPPLEVGSANGTSLLRLNRGLDEVETSLDKVASGVARRDLDQMAFPSRAPIPGVAMSSGFGRRIDPITRQLAQHAGFDYVAPYGTTILASAGGRVRRAGPYGAFGRTVEIDHGDGIVTRYGHLSRVLVRVGELALPGQAIATVGSTGRSTGPHLHFEILRDGTQVRPDLYLAGQDP